MVSERMINTEKKIFVRIEYVGMIHQCCKRTFKILTGVALAQRVSLRIYLNIDSIKFAGVTSAHVSSVLTTQTCNVSMALNSNNQKMKHKQFINLGNNSMLIKSYCLGMYCLLALFNAHDEFR